MLRFIIFPANAFNDRVAKYAFFEKYGLASIIQQHSANNIAIVFIINLFVFAQNI